ncbi:MAG: LacI family transcriptional regulator [Promicromonosporaceae bacterium]|nr:LacI family transcriptional regulator [Promicromonosporaceae bacterium]
MAVTMHDVAARAGVSIKTVSNVINGYPHIRPTTRSRVEDAIEALGYQVNVAARNLRQGRTGMIGLAVPELRVPYFAELAYSVMNAAEAHGLVLLIEQTGPHGEHEGEVLRGPRRRLTDGLLFSPVAMDPVSHPELDVDYPLVLLGERVFDAGVDHVTMANVEAARAATEHLVAEGCRHIAVVGYHAGEAMGSAALRFEGYRQGLAAAGLEFDPRLAGEAERWVRATGAQAMTQVLDSGAPVDGVFAMNDALALGALHVLHARGLRVPEDVAVVGFDDIEDAGYSEPPLSSIDPGRDEIAHRAVELLVARIAGHDAAPQRVIAPYALVERESTRRG